MALTSNPTKTRRIEKSFKRENKVRFKKFHKGAIDGLKATQRIDNSNQTITNVNDFTMTDSELERYMKFLRARAYQDIIGVNLISDANSAVDIEDTDQWQGKYIKASYARGVDAGQKQLKGVGLSGDLSMADLRDLFAAGTDERTAQILIDTQTLHGETVASLQRTSLTSLVQATETMIAQIRRDAEFARTQVDPRITNLIKDLTKRISVANSAGEQIASTETIQAFQNGQINNATIASEKGGVEINLRWLTRADSRVRDLHARWHGKIMTPIEASQNINESPWNCRCGLINEPPSAANNKKRNEMFNKERKKLLDLENS